MQWKISKYNYKYNRLQPKYRPRSKILILFTSFIIILTAIFNLPVKDSRANNNEDIWFFDNFKNKRETWSEVAPDGSWKIENGEYIGKAYLGGKNPSYSIAGNENWENYSFSLKLKGVRGVDKTILFRADDQNHNSYSVNIVSTYEQTKGNIVELNKMLNDTGFNLIKRDFPNEKERWYEVKVDIKNKTEDEEKYSDIKVTIDGELIISYQDKTNPILTGKIGLFIWDGGQGDYDDTGRLVDETHYDNVMVTSYDYTSTPTPTPTPTLTPTPTPTPTHTPSTTKVILAPGMGASWNTDAILNCKLENYSGDWTLAPFAESIYSPIINSLSQSGFDVTSFYYDWRKRIISHNDELEELLNNISLQENEKIDFVGHSMGGLVGRAYLEEKGQNSRVNKYISAGSPHQGTALAYPAWYGGEIWNNSLVTKIAATLLLKRCGIKYPNKLTTLRQIAPSFQDLLPTYKFLRDSKTRQLKGVNTNSWLLGSDFPSNTNAQIATLSGFGFDTLSIIKVRQPTRKDQRMRLWEEGRPVGKEFSTEGDGTVLNKSSKIENNTATNFEINQNHGGLISSQEAINTIIGYLKGNLPEQTLQTAGTQSKSEEESALVMITYPATFISFDPQNKPKKDKNNVVSYINPKSGKYKIGILPLDKESTLLIGQFLKDGRYSWKEYKIRGRLPLAKTIEFNPRTLNENPLK